MRTKIALLAIAIVAMFNTSCKKEDEIKPITPVIVDEKPVMYTVVASGENVIFTPESTKVEKGGVAQFSIKALNSLFEPDYFDFRGIKTLMKETDSVINLENIDKNDLKVFVKYKAKKIAEKIFGKKWYIYSTSNIDGSNITTYSDSDFFIVNELISEKGEYFNNGKVDGFINFKLYANDMISFAGYNKATLIPSSSEEELLLKISQEVSVNGISSKEESLVLLKVRK